MAITKEKKQSLINEYIQDLQEANNLVLIKQSGLSVSTDTNVRRSVRDENGKYNVVRKRLFLRALNEAGYSQVDLDQMPGSAVAIYAK
jgi:ribosomal protein L10